MCKTAATPSISTSAARRASVRTLSFVGGSFPGVGIGVEECRVIVSVVLIEIAGGVLWGG